MKKSQFSQAKIVEIPGIPSQGQAIDEMCRLHNISPATFYNWPVRRCGHKCGGMDTEELRKLKALQAENARLKKLLADKSLDYAILTDACERLKKF